MVRKKTTGTFEIKGNTVIFKSNFYDDKFSASLALGFFSDRFVRFLRDAQKVQEMREKKRKVNKTKEKRN